MSSAPRRLPQDVPSVLHFLGLSLASHVLSLTPTPSHTLALTPAKPSLRLALTHTASGSLPPQGVPPSHPLAQGQHPSPVPAACCTCPQGGGAPRSTAPSLPLCPWELTLPGHGHPQPSAQRAPSCTLPRPCSCTQNLLPQDSSREAAPTTHSPPGHSSFLASTPVSLLPPARGRGLGLFLPSPPSSSTSPSTQRLAPPHFLKRCCFL